MNENKGIKSDIYSALLKPDAKTNPEQKPDIGKTGPKTEQLKLSPSSFSLMPIQGGLSALPGIQNDSARVDTIPLLSKNTVPFGSPTKSQQTNENSQNPVETTYVKDITHVLLQNPLPPLPAYKVNEYTSLLKHCIEMLQNGSFNKAPLSIVKEVLPPHTQNPLPPLPDPIGFKNSSEKSVQEVNDLHEPLPPLSNHLDGGFYQTLVPIKSSPEVLYPPTVKNISQLSVQDPLPPLAAPNIKLPSETALPITEGSYYPADVVPSGTYPAAVSVLKEVPVVHVADPLPPIQKIAYTNVEISNGSILQAPKGPYPANLPIGSPYPPTV